MEEARAILATDDRKLPPVPDAMRGEANRWFAAQDTFQAWFTVECVASPSEPGHELLVKDLQKRYKMYVARIGAEAIDDGEGADAVLPDGGETMGMNAFVVSLRRAGAVTESTSGGPIMNKSGERIVVGMRLRVAAVAA
jgi:hypothetical protein